MRNRKPTWWVLYSLLPLAIVLLVAVGRWVPAGAGRAFADATVSLAILGCMALWVRANRIALAFRDAPEETETPFRAWVAYQPPAQCRRPRVAVTTEPRSQVAA